MQSLHQLSHLTSLHLQPACESRRAQLLVELHGQGGDVLAGGWPGTAPVAAAEDAHGDRKGLVVDEARVDREDSHQ